ncbi:uncharacterized protein [Watersipora subatra]|uniref:uncharacterized protein n=1 Tax=Watersipora subatra TaxID=2589382 RepID=UPI00355B292E
MTLAFLPVGTLAMCILIGYVEAAFEHRCKIDDYQQNARDNTLCGRNLADYLMNVLCADAGMNTKRSDIGIFQNKHEADNFLKPSKRSDGLSTGIVCECCLHRCSRAEMSEYCAGSRRKRSVRGALNELDQRSFYEEDATKDLDETMTLEELMKHPVIQQLERQKEINIQRISESKRTSKEATSYELGEDEQYRELRKQVEGELVKLLADQNMRSEEEHKSELEKLLRLLGYY